ncbi:MAG: SufS family cysteine desulfurase [Defluviitaleaceae bacterium]|nr:SufS family cysteine desulfurase [Defluviitaleaceae bacterium]
MLNTEQIRKDFEILEESMNGKPLVYLDSAATALKPKAVLDAMDVYNKKASANVHRGVYKLSNDATDLYEGARTRVAKFLGAKDAREIVFGRGASDALNLVATGYGLHHLKPGDEIITTELEHHSSFLPWQNVAKVTGATLKFIPLTEEGRVTVENFKSVLTAKTKVVAINYISNVMGYLTPIKEIAALAHEVGAVVTVDAAQAGPHVNIDVQDLDVDFLSITGHKIYGPTGIGALYGKYELLTNMEPAQFGGEMVDFVDLPTGTTFKDTPYRFEAGTPPIAGAAGLAVAMDYVEALGWDNIRAHELELRQYAVDELSKIEGVEIYNPQSDTGIVSFNVGTAHPHDMATVYDANGVCLRAGHHCAQLLMRYLKQPATLRASMGIYTTKADIDALVAATKEGKETFDVF